MEIKCINGTKVPASMVHKIDYPVNNDSINNVTIVNKLPITIDYHLGITIYSHFVNIIERC